MGTLGDATLLRLQRVASTEGATTPQLGDRPHQMALVAKQLVESLSFVCWLGVGKLTNLPAAVGLSQSPPSTSVKKTQISSIGRSGSEAPQISRKPRRIEECKAVSAGTPRPYHTLTHYVLYSDRLSLYGTL